MAHAEVRGTRLAWQQFGEGPDLIFLHGVAANRAFWFPIAMQFAAHFKVTLFDLRGHGYSERAPTGYASADMGRDLLGLMDVLGIAQAHVVGHSYGGGAALEAAAIAPQRFSRLALADTRVQSLQAEMRLDDLEGRTGFEQALVDRAGGPAALAGETQIGFRFLEASARLKVAGEIPAGSDEFIPFGEGSGAMRAAKSWLALLDETQARREFPQPGASDAALRGIDLPTLLLYGERSRCWPSAEALARLLPQSQTISVPGGGHFFPISQPVFTTVALKDFLAVRMP
ncbi:MAG: alpha/beta hydrolase [Pseudomonadota bacterium]